MFKKYILWNNTFLKNNIRLKVVTNKKKKYFNKNYKMNSTNYNKK